MLLDEKEPKALNQFEDSTIQRKKLQSILWIVVGILGFLFGILLLVMEHLEPIRNKREELILWYAAIGISVIFGMLAVFGFKMRIAFNDFYNNKAILKIPKFEMYFWIMVLLHISILTFILWDDLF